MKSPSILFLIAVVSTQCGCSSLIRRSGTDVEACQTRAEIREKLGMPVDAGTEKGEEFDQFVTHQKIAEDDANWNRYIKSTFGFGELVALPSAAYHSIRNVVGGQDLRVYYDSDGRVTRMTSSTVQLTPYASLIRPKEVDPTKIPPTLTARPVTRGIEDPARMIEAVLKQAPVGTPVADAKKFMEREGFHCKPMTNQPFGDRTGLDYIDCERIEGGTAVQRRSQVAVVHRDGKVVEVLASTGLVGP